LLLCPSFGVRGKHTLDASCCKCVPLKVLIYNRNKEAKKFKGLPLQISSFAVEKSPFEGHDQYWCKLSRGYKPKKD